MKTKKTLFIILAASLLAATQYCFANGITVTNLSIAGVSGGTAEVEFDVAWENSWHLSWTDDGGATTVTNWDAAWVFIKFKTPGTNWRHAMLDPAGHTPAAGSVVDLGTNDSGNIVGAFIRRGGEGSGTFNCQDVRLNWDFAQSGLGGTNDVDVSVHAIEMVYIPEGAFALGSGGGESDHFYEYPTVSNPYWVTSENAISAGNTGGYLYSQYSLRSSIPALFPKRYAPFYCMKYEVSQGQYADFLNSLDPSRAAQRFPDHAGDYNNTISVQDYEYEASAADRACNYLNSADVLSYLNWAGLRPMTELEFEKACRGTLQPEPNEFAWGSSSITGIESINGIDGSGQETALPNDANATYNEYRKGGPLRVGIFAGPESSRQTSGASYYGIMDLSGNVRELAVEASESSGRNYIPIHGSGRVSPLPESWPGSIGLIMRGGSWNDGANKLCVSYRYTSNSSEREMENGGRGVRTAPQN